jgi:Cu/Ag efflux pump CusA
MRGFTLVFAGLAAAVAAVIDDAVIDVDRLRPRLDERRGGGRRVSAAAVVPEGATETRSAMGNATAIVVLTPVPAVFIDGTPAHSSRRSSAPTSLRSWRRCWSRSS